MPDAGATGLDACKVRSRRLYEEVFGRGIYASSACCPCAGRRRKRNS